MTVHPLTPLVADLFLPQTEHDEDKEPLEAVEDEEENAEGNPGSSDGKKPKDPSQTEQSRYRHSILNAAPRLAAIRCRVRLVRGDILAARKAPHDQEEDDEVDDEEDGDNEQHAVVEGGAGFDETTNK